MKPDRQERERMTGPAGWLTGVALALAPAAALAHPHVFIDTGLEIVFDDEGRLAAVQVVWVYDEFYTMLALEDYGMDPGFTGRVSEAERAELAAIYANWDEGYAGDLHPLLAGRPLELSGPLQVVADVQEGRLVIAHRRAFADRPRLEGTELVLQVYDPTYFTAYTIAAEPAIRGRADCVAEVWGPDWEAASARLTAALEELGGTGGDAETDFPAVGADFAEEVRLRCAEPS
jgi:polyphosphate kinase